MSRPQEPGGTTQEWCAPGIDPRPKTMLAQIASNLSESWSQGTCPRTLALPDTAGSPVYAAAEAGLRTTDTTKSALLCGIGGDESILGFIGFESIGRQRAWTDKEAEFVQLLADILASGLTRWHTERKLATSEHQLKETQRVARLGHYSFDVASSRWSSSPALDAIFEIDDSYDRTFDGWLRIVHPDFRETLTRYVREHVLGQCREFDKEYKIVAVASGEEKWVHGLGQLAVDDSQRCTAMFGTIQDITHRKQADKELRLAASVFSHAREGIIIADADGIIIDVNKALSETTGYSHDEAVGKHLETIQSYRQEDRGGDRGWWCYVSTCGCWTGEIWNRRKNGQRYPGMLTVSAVCDSAGQPQHYIALLTDIAGLKRQELNLEHRAYHDPLTDLPNRTLLADRLRHSMAQADRNRGLVAIVYLDLDGFKAVNDSYGHDVGDKVLTVLAIRFQGAVREADTLSRIGGDEFVAVLSDLAHASDSEPIVSRLLAAAADPIHVGNSEVVVSVSAGVTFYPQAKNANAEELIRQADTALYQAKIAGKNCRRAFDGQQLHSGRGHEGSPAWVRLALQQREFLLHYQPQVNMRTGALLGFEALVRWRRAGGEIVPPGAFLPKIQDDGAAIELDRWVLSTAAVQLESWHAQGIEMPLNVNLGAKTLQDVHFSSYLRGIIADHPFLRGGSLRLEVVETSALADVAFAARTMQGCRDMGVSFLLDDFGTGYSSLAYLKGLPVDEIKIDRSFVRDIPCDTDSLAILEAILALGQKFGLSVVAEGVETEEHGRILLQLGCELGQGFAIAAPMPAEAVPGWLQSWAPPRAWSTQVKIADETLPLLHARVEIRALSRMVEALSINHPLPRPRLDQYECEFGKWLNSHAQVTGGANATLKAAKHLHRDLHDLAAELDSLRQAGQGPEFLNRGRDFNATRDRLLSVVDALAEELGGASPTRGGRKTP